MQAIKEAIQSATSRGMSFHVFSDQPNYVGGEWVGKALYHTSWNSYAVAKAVAQKETNGVVYNSAGEVI